MSSCIRFSCPRVAAFPVAPNSIAPAPERRVLYENRCLDELAPLSPLTSWLWRRARWLALSALAASSPAGTPLSDGHGGDGVGDGVGGFTRPCASMSYSERRIAPGGTPSSDGGGGDGVGEGLGGDGVGEGSSISDKRMVRSATACGEAGDGVSPS